MADKTVLSREEVLALLSERAREGSISAAIRARTGFACRPEIRPGLGR